MRWKREMMGWMYLDSYLHLHGNRQLRLENCRRVLECNDLRVRLETRDLTVEIWGTGLRVFDYKSSSMLVTGRITGIELSETR